MASTAAVTQQNPSPGPDITVSVILPIYNEINYVHRTLDSLLAQDFPTDTLEILVVDGNSDDGTSDVLAAYSAAHSHVTLLQNKHRTVPHALNLGIALARGGTIIRMDCHSVYPDNYVSRLVNELHAQAADNVGGVCIACPPDDTAVSAAIAIAMSSRFGVGGASFRVGAPGVKSVDTVPFGCYRKEVFERIGKFDVDLTRNQDDELNSRLIKHGGKIVLIPDIKIRYYTRDSIPKVARTYYQYGLFKPLANQRSGRISSFRQLVPAAFILVLVITALLALFANGHPLPFLAFIGLYAASALLVSAQQAFANGRMALWVVLPIVYLVIHLSYGAGYWIGLFQLLTRARVPGNFRTTR